MAIFMTKLSHVFSIYGNSKAQRISAGDKILFPVRRVEISQESIGSWISAPLPDQIMNTVQPGSGADPGVFFRRGCTRLLLYFNTNKPHSFFFCRIPVVLENRRSSQEGGGGLRTPCTLPLYPPLRIS